MGRILTTRRAEWLPGLAVLGAAAGVGALLGLSLGRTAWLLDLAFTAGLLVALLAWSFLRARSSQPAAKGRGRLRGLPRRKPAPYDLANDDSTKNQRYLM